MFRRLVSMLATKAGSWMIGIQLRHGSNSTGFKLTGVDRIIGWSDGQKVVGMIAV